MSPKYCLVLCVLSSFPWYTVSMHKEEEKKNPLRNIMKSFEALLFKNKDIERPSILEKETNQNSDVVLEEKTPEKPSLLQRRFEQFKKHHSSSFIDGCNRSIKVPVRKSNSSHILLSHLSPAEATSPRAIAVLQNLIEPSNLGAVIVSLLSPSILLSKEKVNLPEPPYEASQGLVLVCQSLTRHYPDFLLTYLIALCATLTTVDEYIKKSKYHTLHLAEALKLDRLDVDLFYKLWDEYVAADVKGLLSKGGHHGCRYKNILNICRRNLVQSIIALGKTAKTRLSSELATRLCQLLIQTLEFVFDEAIGILQLLKKSKEKKSRHEFDKYTAIQAGLRVRTQQKVSEAASVLVREPNEEIHTKESLNVATAPSTTPSPSPSPIILNPHQHLYQTFINDPSPKLRLSILNKAYKEELSTIDDEEELNRYPEFPEKEYFNSDFYYEITSDFKEFIINLNDCAQRLLYSNILEDFFSSIEKQVDLQNINEHVDLLKHPSN